MIRYYRIFEDIQRNIFVEYNNFLEMLEKSAPKSYDHVGYLYQKIGSVDGVVPLTEMIVEILNNGETTLRKGYFQVI